MGLLERASPSLEREERDAVFEYFEARAAAVDAGQATTREGIAFLRNRRLISSDPADPGEAVSLERLSAVVSAVAYSDMSTAFCLWCHLMVQEYLSWATAGSRLRTSVLSELGKVDRLGSTALASAIAHLVGRVPLPITARQTQGGLALSGRISWASNLFAPYFVMVTAVAREDGAGPLIVAVPGDCPGLRINSYPQLLALQSTGSSSLVLEDAPITPDWVVTDDFTAFVEHIRPPFLLLQSSFCWGLANRALTEARAAIRGIGEVFRGDLDELEAELADVVARIHAGTRDSRREIPIRALVELRLVAGRLATKAVALEAKVVGGRGYVVSSPTARRLREAAFLPIQSPTEGQLRWELTQSA